jgi:hypothetical protein
LLDAADGAASKFVIVSTGALQQLRRWTIMTDTIVGMDLLLAKQSTVESPDALDLPWDSEAAATTVPYRW